MWAVQNLTAFAAERSWSRDKDGGEVWIVAVKGTFAIEADGSTSLPDVQVPVTQAPVYSGKPGASSLLYDSDLVLTKVGTDIVLHGHAYADRGSVMSRVDVGLTIGPLNKRIRVYGDRNWIRRFGRLATSDPIPFERMPIVYERAFGGREVAPADALAPRLNARNPVGRGFSTDIHDLVGQPAPNLEDPAAAQPTPIGFGPIAAHWSPRVERAGTCDRAWQEKRMPLPPEDFDDRFYNCAPDDQQTSQPLVGGEVVELTNLTPTGWLRFRIT